MPVADDPEYLGVELEDEGGVICSAIIETEGKPE